MAENTGAWLTQDAFDRLTQELEYLSGPYRQEIVDRIAQARDEGDLRENGGYHAARDEQAKNEARIKQLKHLLETAHIGDTPADDGVVEHGMVIEAEVAGRTLKFLLGSAKLRTLCRQVATSKVFSDEVAAGCRNHGR